MKTITKKIDTEWLEMIMAGKKKFELRMADFDIEEGDVLRLEEWEGEGESRKFTGREFLRRRLKNRFKIYLQ